MNRGVHGSGACYSLIRTFHKHGRGEAIDYPSSRLPPRPGPSSEPSRPPACMKRSPRPPTLSRHVLHNSAEGASSEEEEHTHDENWVPKRLASSEDEAPHTSHGSTSSSDSDHRRASVDASPAKRPKRPSPLVPGYDIRRYHHCGRPWSTLSLTSRRRYSPS